MRLSKAPPTLLSLLTVILSSHHIIQATPFPDQEFIDGQNSTLEERGCANSCGWAGQLCCAADQACITAAGQASCGVPSATAQAFAANGQWQYYTSTYVETDLVTITSIFSTFVGQATTTAAQAPAPTTVIAPVTTTALVCNSALSEKPCGTICCAAGQVCLYQGQCGAAVNSDASSAYFSSIVAASSASPYIRPTSATTQTITSIGSATTTVAFQTPVTSDGSNNNGTVVASTNNGLSGGAIAGIVVGVLLGLFLLLLLCAALCFRELFNGLLAIFGLGPRTRRRRTEETYIEERHSRHASGGAAAAGGRRTWYGASQPARPSRPQKKSSGWGGATAVGAGLGTLALLLGLRRKREQRNEKESYGSGSSYMYSDYTSASSESSDRRTRDTRRSSGRR